MPTPALATRLALAWTALFGALHLWWCVDTHFFVGHDRGTVDTSAGLTVANLCVVVLCALGAALLLGRVPARLAVLLGRVAVPLLIIRGALGVVDQVLRFTGAAPNGLADDDHYTTTFAKWTGAAFDVGFLVGGILFLLALRGRPPRDGARIRVLKSSDRRGVEQSGSSSGS